MGLLRRATSGLWLALALCLACQNRPPPDATITARDGEATIKKKGEGAPLDATLATGLYEADTVSTGADGHVTLTFSGRNTLTLQPNTTVVIRRGGATGAELGAVVLSGSARAASPGATNLLVIGSPFGMTELGGSELIIDVDLSKGLAVLVGEVILVKDGTSTTIGAGNALSIDGLVVPIAAGGPIEVAGLTTVLTPQRATLVTTSKGVQVQAAGTDWSEAVNKQQLDPGAMVRTRKAKGTQVRFEDGSAVALLPGAELRFDEAQGNDKATKAKYTLTSGGGDLHLTRKEGSEAQHTVAVAGLGLEVRPGDREADVDLRPVSGGAYEVGVRFGHVRLSDGTDVEAGTAITVKDGKVVSEARSVAPADVELRAGTTSVVYYQVAVPPVAFDWREGTNDASAASAQITVSNDKAFKDLVFSETVRKAGFVYDGFRPGRYYWRVKTGDTTREGSLHIQKGGENDCANCKRTNIINDTGEKTVVYFQQALPAITFQWKPIAGAVQYRVKIFADGAFERPHLEATSEGTSLAFQAGALEDGKYFWLVSAIDAQGKAISTGNRTNGLEIAYDNVINDLVIRSPKSGQKITGERISTAGELALGARLYINGKQADLDGKGRFKETVSLKGGDRTIVYRTQAADGVQRFYVRELKR